MAGDWPIHPARVINVQEQHVASIGVLKHVARHVSGQQCESYLMKVARLRLLGSTYSMHVQCTACTFINACVVHCVYSWSDIRCGIDMVAAWKR